MQQFFDCALKSTLYLSLFSVVATAGCGGSRQLLSVKGTVSVDGSPVTSGTVRFEPTTEGRTARAKINEDGTFMLICDGSAGAIPGEYRIAVNPLGVSLTEDEEERGVVAPPQSDTIPKRYHSVATSGLTFTVEPGTENIVPLDLTTK